MDGRTNFYFRLGVFDHQHVEFGDPNQPNPRFLCVAQHLDDTYRVGHRFNDLTVGSANRFEYVSMGEVE